MPINESYDEEASAEAVAAALDNFYSSLIKRVGSLQSAVGSLQAGQVAFAHEGYAPFDCSQ